MGQSLSRGMAAKTMGLRSGWTPEGMGVMAQRRVIEPGVCGVSTAWPRGESHGRLGTGLLGDTADSRTETSTEVCTSADLSDVSLV